MFTHVFFLMVFYLGLFAELYTFALLKIVSNVCNVCLFKDQLFCDVHKIICLKFQSRLRNKLRQLVEQYELSEQQHAQKVMVIFFSCGRNLQYSYIY